MTSTMQRIKPIGICPECLRLIDAEEGPQCEHAATLAWSTDQIATADNAMQSAWYLSYSQYGRWLDCETAALAHYHDREPDVYPSSRAFDEGRLFHAVMEGQPGAELDQYKGEYVTTKKGGWNAYGTAAIEAAERVRSCPEVMDGENVQQELDLRVDMPDTWHWRGKIDWLESPDYAGACVRDWKYVRDVWGEDWVHVGGRNCKVPWYQVRALKQLLLYARMVAANADDGIAPDYVEIVAADKQKPGGLRWLRWDAAELAQLYDHWYSVELPRDVQRILRVKCGLAAPRACGKCNYCRRNATLTAPETRPDINHQAIGASE